MAHGPLLQAQRFVSQRKPQRPLRQKEGKRSVVCWRRPLSWCSMMPLSNRGGNGQQIARSRFALLPVAVLRSLRLGGGSRHFWLGVFCPRYSRYARCGLWAAALTSATQRKAPPSWWGNGAEVRMLAEGSEGQRRTFRAEPMRTAANWFRRLKRKTPHRGHSHAGFLRTPQLFPTGAPGLEVGGHKRPPLPAEMSAF